MSAYNYRLRFRLQLDAPPDSRRLYMQVYDDILSEEKERFQPYLESWIRVLQDGGIDTSVDTQLLDRLEGGIGGSNNVTDRQIRFDMYTERLPWTKFGEITLIASSSSDESVVWTTEDANAFGKAFQEILEIKVRGCVDFCIVVDC
jgi:hypothetical protein